MEEQNINNEEIRKKLEEPLIEDTKEELLRTSPVKSGKRSSKTSFLIALAMIVTFFAGGIIAIFAYRYFLPSTSAKLDNINALVRQYYSGKIDNTVLDDALATAYMEAIGDRYSFYKNAEDSNKVEQSLKGTASGIGVTIFNDEKNKSLTVFRVDEASPADKAGIKIGDKIVAIDDNPVKKMGYEQSVEAIKREIGEEAKITLLRGEEKLEIMVLYEDFVRQSVYYEVVENYGYVTITAFNESTVPQFKKAYKLLKEQNVKGLIFDLRDNGGGTVDSTCEILDILLGECDLITIVYADGSKVVSNEAKSDADKCDLPMVVLTNERTASAAELFAANLRDMANAPLIGNNTFGKGVVQRTYFLDDGSCVRFTVGEFLPAGGKGFDGEGLAPDFEVTFNEEQAANPYFLGADEPYLKKAIETLNEIVAKEK